MKLGDRDWAARPRNLLLALSVALITILLSAGGLFVPIEDQLTSLRARILERKPTHETVIVEIDARSMAELNTWPWPRRHHAQLIRQLHRAGAAIIAFDVDFSARSEEGDAELAAAIKAADRVVLPIFQQKLSGNADDRRTISSRPNALLGTAWVGSVNIFPDADGIVREYPAATFIDGSVQPSIATLLAEKNGLGARSFQPDWSINANDIPRFSFSDVLAARVPEESLRDKRILVGATAIELGDRYAVPRYGIVPGVVVQALATESLLQNRAVHRTGFVLNTALIILIALMLRPRPVGRPYRHVGVFVMALASILVAPAIAYQLWSISIDSAALLFTVVAAFAVRASVNARRRQQIRAETDGDSGLHNRVRLEKDVATNVSEHRILCVASIERYVAIRDGLGLDVTTELVCCAARVIEPIVGSAGYRIAPDTLAWLMPNDELTLNCMLSDVNAALREPIAIGGSKVDINVTMGLAHLELGLSSVQVIERAMAAVTTARSTGLTHDWYRGPDPQLRRQLSMMGELRAAMTDGSLRLVYQPKMSLATGWIRDAEALVRWTGSGGVEIPPDTFIPLAEATGVVREITKFALRKAATDMTLWARQGFFARIAVNVSALDLETPGFDKEIEKLLGEFDLSPGQLTLEITESALIRSADVAIATLTNLRQLGVRLSVDDYGTGQSTLSYLKNLPVHEIKIDRSFVTDVASDGPDTILVRSTIELAHDLGLEVVAEGIEDQAALEALRRMGCDYGQGYFLDKPMDAEAFSLKLVAQSGRRRVA